MISDKATRAEALAVMFDHADDVGEYPRELLERVVSSLKGQRVASAWFSAPARGGMERHRIVAGGAPDAILGMVYSVPVEDDVKCLAVVRPRPVAFGRQTGRVRQRLEDEEEESDSSNTNRVFLGSNTRVVIPEIENWTVDQRVLWEALSWVDSVLRDAGWLLIPGPYDPVKLKGE